MQDNSISHIFKNMQTHDCGLTYSFHFHFCKNGLDTNTVHDNGRLQKTYCQIKCENKLANYLYYALLKGTGPQK